MRGKLVVFEGIDGAGTETQSKMLLAYLKTQMIPAERICYPDYGGVLGKLIAQFLEKKRSLSTEMQFLLYAGDMVKDKEKIEGWLNEGKVVVCDRYFNSTMAYQGVRGFYLKKALRFAEDFGIPRPDAVIFLRISPEESARRKMGEHGRLDRNEEDSALLEKVNRCYYDMAGENAFGRWFIVDGERPREDVFMEIRSVLKNSGTI
jgi:dTMP kinase